MLTNPDLIVALILNILIYIYGLNTLNKPLKITVKVFCVENLYWFLMGIFIVLNLVFNVFILEQLPPSHVDLDSSKLTLFTYYISGWLIFFILGTKVVGFHYKKSLNIINYRKPMKSLEVIALAIFVIELVVLVLYIMISGGFENFIFNHRETVYSGQWSNSSSQHLVNTLRSLSGFVFLACTLIAGYIQAKIIKKKGRPSLLPPLLVIPGLLIKIALFSRGAVLFIIVYWLAKNVELKSASNRFFLTAMILFLLLLTGIYFGFSQRGGVVSLDDLSIISGFVINTGLNGTSGVLNSMYVDNSENIFGVVPFLMQINPIPSFIFGINDYENNLTVLLFGQSSGSSMPMPFIGEVFYNLGWWGLSVAFFQGGWSKFIDIKMGFGNTQTVTMKYLVLYGTTIFSFIYMPHSGVRSCTRLLVWSLMIFISLKLIKILLKEIKGNNK